MKVGEKLLPVALEPAFLEAGVFGHFTWVAQQCAAIQCVRFAPNMADAFVTVCVEIVTCAPERAKILRTADGFTISDRGISQITYAMRRVPNRRFEYQTPIPTEDEIQRGHTGQNWFEVDGAWYLSAEVEERVVVHLRNESKESVVARPLLMYREIVS